MPRRDGHDTNALTPAEQLVLDKLREGKPNKVIAYELDRSELTVKKQLEFIFRKLGVTNRTQAALKTIGAQL